MTDRRAVFSRSGPSRHAARATGPMHPLPRSERFMGQTNGVLLGQHLRGGGIMATKTTRARRPTKRSGRRAPTKKVTGTRSTGRRDVIALIKADHAAVSQLFRRYQTLGDRAVRTKRAVAD